MNPATIKLARDEAMLDFEGGNLPEAEVRLDELIRRIGQPQSAILRGELCQCLLNRATVRRVAHRWEEALEDLAAAESLAQTLAAFSRSSILLNIHHTRIKLRAAAFSPAHDLELARQSLAAMRSLGGDEWIYDEMESDLAFQGKDWERAAQFASKAAQALAAEGWRRAEASCRLRAGRACLELNDLARAEAEIAPAHRHFERLGPPDQLAASQMALARLEHAYGNHGAAWESAINALSGIESLIRYFRSLFDQQRFLHDKLDYYQHCFDIGLAKAGEQGYWRAWSVAERAKSFYLCHLVANADVRLFDGVDAAQLAKLHELELQLDRCETSPEETSADARTDAQIADLYQEKQRLMSQIMRANPRWGALRIPPPFDIEAELRRLDAAWIPLSYFWRRRSEGATLYIFHAGSDRRPFCAQSRWAQDELSRLDAHLDRLRGSVSPLTPLVPDGLAEKIIPPLLIAAPDAGRHILVSPHEQLRAVPIHILPVARGERLIDAYGVQYLPTLAMLPMRKAAAHSGKVLLIGCEQDGFGDSRLEEVPDEIESLNKLWSERRPGRVEAALVPPDGSLAQAGLPLDKWEDFEVLHAACHGVFPDERPLDAALRLGEEALRCSEFFAVRLNATLVCLSACDLGRQARRSATLDIVSDEWIGLYLPLFYAGAQALLVSSWGANSRVAALLMTALHEALSDGAAPSEAFRKAVQSLGRKPAQLWANWRLVGFPHQSIKATTEKEE